MDANLQSKSIDAGPVFDNSVTSTLHILTSGSVYAKSVPWTMFIYGVEERGLWTDTQTKSQTLLHHHLHIIVHGSRYP